MSKPDDFSSSGPHDRSEDDIASLLLKMQRQLLFLEKKVDILIDRMQEKPYREKSFTEKPLRKKTFSRSSRPSGHSRRHDDDSRKEGTGEKNSRKPFYSRFRKSGDASRGPGPRKKSSSHKGKKQK